MVLHLDKQSVKDGWKQNKLTFVALTLLYKNQSPTLEILNCTRYVLYEVLY
jgi:hypothetical protein